MPTVYEIVTDRIVSMLQAGTVPWRKPWAGEGGRPRNLASGKPYQGINVFMLATAPYSSPWWLTFNQGQSSPYGAAHTTASRSRWEMRGSCANGASSKRAGKMAPATLLIP